MRDGLPTGTVTFLFTDVEGSTKLLHELGAEAYDEALITHRSALREAFQRYGGVEVDTQGDAFFYAFPTACGAVDAAREGVEALSSGPIRVRVGLHTGTPHLGQEGYVGDDVHLGARIAATAHGGQVVLSRETRVLVDGDIADLGEHRLKDIAEAVPIFQLGDGSFPPLKTISNTNLPRPASSFVGRDDELLEVLSRFENGARLVTLTGPGGTGKTRLGIEAAATLIPEYKAGVFWVGLATLRDPALVTETVAQTLGAKDGLADHITDREMLLLLDNLEQVVECAPDLSELLSACPNLTLLVTSRELLRIQGEVEYAVPPLAEAEAVRLFCERAQLEPSEAIAELCSRLDSLPLAVELAAARTSVLSPNQILDRLCERLDLLKGGRDADPRQQTLRAAIEWSYELLTLGEQRLFARLSVFFGGCTLEAAEDVCDADPDTLQSLAEQSLLRFTNERYWMLETIREYAAEQLDGSGERDECLRRHASHYVSLAARGDEGQEGSEQALWLDRLEVDHDNVRAVLARAHPEGASYELKLAADMSAFWLVRGHLSEGRTWLDGAIARAEAPSAELARALHGSANLARVQGDIEEAKRFEQLSLAHWRSVGDSAEIGRTLNTLAAIAAEEGDLDAAIAEQEEALNAFREADHRRGVALTTSNLGYLLASAGENDRARALCEESLGLEREFGNPRGVGLALLNLGLVVLRQGHEDRAHDLYSEGLTIFASLGYRDFVAYALEGIAAIDARQGATERALRLFASALALREEVGAHLDPLEQEVHEATLECIRAACPPEIVGAAVESARSETLDEAVEYALASID